MCCHTLNLGGHCVSFINSEFGKYVEKSYSTYTQVRLIQHVMEAQSSVIHSKIYHTFSFFISKSKNSSFLKKGKNTK